MKTVKALLLLICLCSAALGQGVVRWDESVDGPFSSSPGTSTPLGSFQPGTNSIFGASELTATGNENGIITEDYFNFVIPPSLQIVQINVTVDRPITFLLANADFATSIAHVTSRQSGDLLPQLQLTSVLSGSYGVDIYNYDLQDYSTVANYRLDFVVTPVPEPSTWVLIGMAGLMFCFPRQRRFAQLTR